MLMSTASTKVDIYDIVISRLDSKFTATCEVSKVSEDILLKIPNPRYKILQESFEHLQGNKFNDTNKKSFKYT